MPRMHMVMTRTGYGPELIEDPPPPSPLVVYYYAPKPAWMDHIPGPFLRFKNRMDFDNHLRRTNVPTAH